MIKLKIIYVKSYMELMVKKISSDLEGEVYFNHKIYKVPFVIPGDIIKFIVIKHGKKRKLIPQSIQRTTKDIDFLVEPKCRYAGLCGGCKGQHLKYDYQWNLKIHDLKKWYENEYGIQPILIPAESIYHYRNRMDFVVNESIVGLRKPQFFDQIVDIENCLIQKKEANSILEQFRKLLQQYPSIGFNRKTKNGCIKYITIRIAKTAFIIFTIYESILKNNKVYELYQEFINEFIKKIKNLEVQFRTKISLKECYVNEYSEVSNVSNGKLLYGEPYMQIQFGSLNFYLSPDAFFQPNLEEIQKMFQSGIDILLKEKDIFQNTYHLVDLYCGAGTLSLFLLDKLYKYKVIDSVIGIESLQSAIENAKRNFESFFKDKDLQIPYKFSVMDLNRTIQISLNPSTILILDPPRSGIHKEVLDWIQIHHTKIHYILYLSCNPEKQQYDIKTLSKYFKILTIIFGDPFPHTSHWESLIILKHI